MVAAAMQNCSKHLLSTLPLIASLVKKKRKGKRKRKENREKREEKKIYCINYLVEFSFSVYKQCLHTKFYCKF